MRHTVQVRRTRLGVAGAVAALSVGLLAACIGDAADPTTSTPTSSASSGSASPRSPATSASPSPTSAYMPVKPKFPAAAKKQTGAGAVAFAEYYWAALNYAWTKPDDRILVGLSSKSCFSCEFFKKSASDLVRERQRLDKPPIRVDAARLVYVASGEGQVLTEVTRTTASTVDRAGKMVQTNTLTKLYRALKLEWIGEWRVIDRLRRGIV